MISQVTESNYSFIASPANKAFDYGRNYDYFPIVLDDNQGYVTINEEFISDCGGLDATGSFLIYVLHPLRGSIQFTIEFDDRDKEWQVSGDESAVIPVEEIIWNEIISRLPKR